jgi:multiple sugar transport system ATP-binding protein
MSRVLLEDVVKFYDRKVLAVDHLTLEVADGEFFVLVGPSGCGKSTALRLVAGLEELTSGRIYIGERLVNDVPPKDRDIAMVFQNYALYPHMTALDNMAFGLKLRRVAKDEIHDRVRAAARVLSIEHLLDRKPKALSGGERQRVAVGRAIVRNPKVFLFDEPLSNLDAKLRVQMRTELARIHKRLGTTMIYVTHDQVEAMTLGQRIGVMFKGCLLQVADAMTLYQRPVNKFVAGFIGSPPMNFLAGVLRTEDRRRESGVGSRVQEFENSIEESVTFQSQALRVPLSPEMSQRLVAYAGRQVVAGIRPEDIGLPEPGRPGLRAQVDVVEPMGSETLLYLRVAETNLVAKSLSPQYPKPGEIGEFSINNHRLYLFDAETEAAL